MTYHHLTKEERTRFDCLLQAGLSIANIALALNRHASTLYRERRRNRMGRYSCRGYDGRLAQSIARRRASQTNSRPRIAAKVYQQARRYLTRLDLSPAQIARRLPISPEWLYQWIYRQIAAGYQWDKHLRSGRVARHDRHSGRLAARARMTKAQSIHQRPVAANDRLEFGHLEADLVLGRQDCRGAILVVKERASRLTLLAKVARRNSKTVMRALAKLVRPYQGEIKTLTTDNGSEFIRHADFAKRMNCQVYVCDPHSPWQRGQVEGENKNVRQYFPKGFNVDRVGQKRIKAAERKLNLRPRVVLNNYCSLEVANHLSSVALRY